MNKYQNMKIEINEKQPLDEVVRELDRLGYKKKAWMDWLRHQTEVVVAFNNGVYSNFNYFYKDGFEITTLAQLKAMEN